MADTLSWLVERDCLRSDLREARAEVERLRAALEPGKASAIVDGLYREAVRLGYSPYSSKPSLTWLVDEVERLRAALEWYANRQNWKYQGDNFNHFNGWERAARALTPESEGERWLDTH